MKRIPLHEFGLQHIQQPSLELIPGLNLDSHNSILIPIHHHNSILIFIYEHLCICSVPSPLSSASHQLHAGNSFIISLLNPLTPKQYSKLCVYAPAVHKRARTNTRLAVQGPIAVSNQHIGSEGYTHRHLQSYRVTLQGYTEFYT